MELLFTDNITRSLLEILNQAIPKAKEIKLNSWRVFIIQYISLQTLKIL